jgi:hypothetical protein
VVSSQFSAISKQQPAISCQQHWRQPKLTFSVATFNMDVGWFVLFIGVEVEPVGAYAEDGGHSVSFQIAA